GRRGGEGRGGVGGGFIRVAAGGLGNPASRFAPRPAGVPACGRGREWPAVVGRRAPKETEARPRVKNRHGGAPRGERPALWDARRLASAWYAALWRTHGCLARTRTFLGAPPTPRFGVSEASANPGRRHAPRERDGLFDIVSWVETRCCPHPEERAYASASAKSNARARVSKDEDGHGMALMLRDASQRSGSCCGSRPRALRCSSA